MLKRLTPRDRLELLAATFEPIFKAAWIAAVNDIRSNVVLAFVIERLERRDIDGAMRALNLDSAAFRPLERAILEAFEGGGVAATGQMPTLRDPEGHRLVIRFDMRNVGAENWLNQHSSTLITNIVVDQQQAIRTALTEGLEAGNNPRTTALNVVGRVDRATGQRTGGIIGLTSQQAGFVSSARAELASGDPARLRHYLTRERRDKRFDKTVLRAIQSGKPLDQATINRIAGRYSDRLLQLRSEMIARTETMAALGRSNIEAYRQAIESGALDAGAVTKIWHATPDGRVRHTHRSMNGQRVGFYGRFQSPSGATLEFPGDPSAPTAESAGCRCWLQIKADHLAGLE